jgi:hypothetical protein
MKKVSTVSFKEGCFVGLDISDKQGTFILLAEDGRAIEEGKVPMSKSGLIGRFGGRRPCCIAIETGTQSPWVSRALKEMGDAVIVANSRQIPSSFAAIVRMTGSMP